MRKLAAAATAILFVLGLGACKKPDKVVEEKQVVFDVMGTTYYNRTSPVNNQYGSITIYKEGDFELYEFIEKENKLVLIRGDYTQRDNEYDLYPKDSKYVPEKIVFHAADDEELVLDTVLPISGVGDSYVLKEQLPEITEAIEDPVIFYNMYEPEGNHGTSYIELYADGRFRLTEIQGMGASLVEGRYSREGNVYMFSNFEPFKDCFGEDVHNFEFRIYDENTMVLNEYLSVVEYGAIFSRTGVLPEGFPANKEAEVTMSFVHEPIEYVAEEYTPYIQMFEETHEFIFAENVYSGIANIYGHYDQTPLGYVFYVDDNSMMTGYAGQDVSEFEIVYDQANGGYVINTDICMTRANDSFYFYYYGD